LGDFGFFEEKIGGFWTFVEKIGGFGIFEENIVGILEIRWKIFGGFRTFVSKNWGILGFLKKKLGDYSYS